jgi:hypothetical protein
MFKVLQGIILFLELLLQMAVVVAELTMALMVLRAGQVVVAVALALALVVREHLDKEIPAAIT